MTKPSRRPTRRAVLALPLGLGAASALAEAPRVPADLPLRQDDPRWRDEVMWRRDSVLRVDTEFNGHPLDEAQSLLRDFGGPNTIGDEGCLVTCLAMVLRLLEGSSRWTPSTVNAEAQARHFWTPAGLSMAPVGADLVLELTDGAVQQFAKEEYGPRARRSVAVVARSSPLLRAYRGLGRAERDGLTVMLKTGTWDDTVASHYVLLHPEDDGRPDDARVLDPAMPLDRTGPWRLSDSARRLREDAEIAQAWDDEGIGALDLMGVWLFARRGARSLAALARRWAGTLSGA